MITDVELAALCDKSSRDPELVKLYRDNDFLAAYAKHTDLRVQADPHQAVGGAWDEYGVMQRDFLIAQGLKPKHKFLDFGCGTGRLARKIVHYLDHGNYLGLDISLAAIDFAKGLAEQEGWASKAPFFKLAGADLPRFDFGWAFSVFIHLPIEEVDRVLLAISRSVAPGGQFLFSYVPTPTHKRTGLKQFKHPLSHYLSRAKALSFSLSQVDWPGRQQILRCSR